MTQEEKAKAYDDLLVKLQKAKVDNNVCDERYCCVIDDIVPELKESEDERIRKAILEHIQLCTESIPDRDKFIAWLEKHGEQETDEWKEGNIIRHGGILALVVKGRRAMKSNGELFTVQYPKEWVKAVPNEIEFFLNELEKQGEQNLANSAKTCKDEQKPVVIIPKFKIGDNIKTANEEPLTITKIDDKGYWSEDLFICGFEDITRWELVEQNPAEVRTGYLNVQYAEQKPTDNKMKEILRTEYEKGRADAIEEMQKTAWSEEDENCLSDALWCCKQAASIAKDENDMGNVWFAENWLKSFKERVQPQPKQEWNEEDEKMLNLIICDIESLKEQVYCKTLCDEEIDWLKSLRDRYIWKPSDEQMEALERFIVYHNGSTNYAKDLEELRLQLKKLKDEK